MRFLYHPDTILTASELETLVIGLLAEIRFQAAVDQESIKAVTDTTRRTYSDDYTLTQLHTVRPAELEAIVNDLFVQQATMILGPGPRIICLDFVDIHYHGCPHAEADASGAFFQYIARIVILHETQTADEPEWSAQRLNTRSPITESTGAGFADLERSKVTLITQPRPPSGLR